MVGLFYKAVPFLADEDKTGGSAIHAALDCRRSYSVLLPLQFEWPQIVALTGPPDFLAAPVGGCSGPATLSGRVLDGGERSPRGTCKGRFRVT